MKKVLILKNSSVVETLLKSESHVILRGLAEKGGKAYFVGGCVRDLVLGLPFSDIDIATDCTPQVVKLVAQKLGFKVISSAMNFGTITVIGIDRNYEITTFRSDIETNGRYTKVRFTKSILEDAKRRDFTINALYMNVDGVIFDPIQGWDDIQNKVVKFIGEPKIRIQEDYLRILRYFRFFSIYCGSQKSPDVQLLKVIFSARKKLRYLSRERIWSEFRKILSSRTILETIKSMDYSGVLSELLTSYRIHYLERFLEFETEFCLSVNPINRLIALQRQGVSDWAKNMPLSKKDVRWINDILKIKTDRSAPCVKGFKYKEIKCLTAFAIFNNSFSGKKVNYITEVKRGAKKSFPLTSSDFFKFLNPSKDFGDEVKRVKEIWFASNLKLNRKELLRHLRNHERL